MSALNARRIAVDVAVLAGFVALALVGRPDAVAAGIGAVIGLVGHAARGRLDRLPWGGATVGVVVGLGAAVWFGMVPAQALGVLLAYLQCHDRLTSTRDDRRAIVLAALMLVIGAGVTRDPLFGPAAIAFGVAAPVGLSPPGSGRVGARTALLVSGAVAGVAALLFVVAPRGLAGPRDAVELTGFASEVDLGALDQLLDDPAPVFRAAVRPPVRGPIYWRGVGLDGFDGKTWSNGSAPARTAIQPPQHIPGNAVVIEVEPREPGVMFTSGWPLDVDAGGAQLWADGQGGWSVRTPVDRYRVVAQPPLGPVRDPDDPTTPALTPFTPPEGDAEALARALQLPPDLDPRIRELGAAVAGEGPAREQLTRLVAHLRAGYSYTRRPRDAGAEGPLSLFLFDRKAGHCEYFAAALAVLARTVGIPARVVNGFVGGVVDPETGWVEVRRYHAHAWVEAHVGGWILVDPTPGPASTTLAVPPGGPMLSPVERLRRLWDEGLLAYDRTDQLLALLRAARAAQEVVEGGADPAESVSLPWRGFVALVGGTLALALVAQQVGRRLARGLIDPPSASPAGPVARAWARARSHVVAKGWRIPPSLPPVDGARWLAAHVDAADADAAAALLELAWLYYATHLGHAGGAGPDRPHERIRTLTERVERLAERSGWGPTTKRSAGRRGQRDRGPVRRV